MGDWAWEILHRRRGFETSAAGIVLFKISIKESSKSHESRFRQHWQLSEHYTRDLTNLQDNRLI
jgi:hypothetical protein